MEGVEISADIPSSDEFHVMVKTINNETHAIPVHSMMLVDVFKGLVQEKTQIEPDRQRLIYRGRVLNDGDNIGNYNIEDGHIIHMVAKPANYRELQQQAAAPSGSATESSGSPQVPRTATGAPNNATPSVLAGIPASAIFQIPRATAQPTPDVRQAILQSFARPAAPVAAATNAENTRNEGRGSTSSQLENIRQGMLTMNTLLSMNADFQQQYQLSMNADFQHQYPSGVQAPAVPSDGSNPAAFRRFYIGQWIDVKDTVQQWLEATVMNIDHREQAVFVHYNGWPRRWDEWIRWDSPRIAPFRSRTTHSMLSGMSCPSPNVIPPHARRTGITDVRTIIPDMVRLYQSMQPMMTALAESVIDDLHQRPVESESSTDGVAVSEDVPWQRYHRALSSSSPPPPLTTTTTPGDAGVSSPPSATTSAQASDSQDHLRQQYQNLIPLLDRFGRVLTDFSSLLWTEVDTYRPPPPANNNIFAGLSGFPANSFESRLLTLLRERPPSPPPQRAFQAPIHNFFRPEDAAGAAGVLLGRAAGGGSDNHVHIAIFSPTPATIPAVSPPVAPTSTSSASSTINRTANSSVSTQSTVTGDVATNSTNSSSNGGTSSTGGNGGTGNSGVGASVMSTTTNANPVAASTPEALSQSVADLTSSLQQQAQQLARRTQELTERTSAVSEITQTLGQILRSRREQLLTLQQQQQLQQLEALAAATAIATNGTVSREDSPAAVIATSTSQPTSFHANDHISLASSDMDTDDHDHADDDEAVGHRHQQHRDDDSDEDEVEDEDDGDDGDYGDHRHHHLEDTDSHSHSTTTSSAEDRAERQYLQDLLLREYIRGDNDGVDLDGLSENERLVDIESELLLASTASPSTSGRSSHRHHLLQYPSGGRPHRSEPSDVSALLGQRDDYDHNNINEYGEDDDDDHRSASSADWEEESVNLGDDGDDDDGGVQAMIDDIMVATQAELDRDVYPPQQPQPQVQQPLSPSSAGAVDDQPMAVLDDLDSGISKAIEEVAANGATLMPVAVDEPASSSSSSSLSPTAIDPSSHTTTMAIPRTDFTHHGLPLHFIGQVAPNAHDDVDRVPYFNLPNSR